MEGGAVLGSSDAVVGRAPVGAAIFDAHVTYVQVTYDLVLGTALLAQKVPERIDSNLKLK